MDLPHSDAPFFKAYPAEVAEAFCECHVVLRDDQAENRVASRKDAPRASSELTDSSGIPKSFGF